MFCLFANTFDSNFRVKKGHFMWPFCYVGLAIRQLVRFGTSLQRIQHLRYMQYRNHPELR